MPWITIDSGAFAAAIAGVAPVVPSRPAVPHLAGIRLSTEDGVVRALASDSTTFIEQTATPVSADADRHVLVSGHLLADIAKALKGGEVTLELSDKSLVVKHGKSKFTLPTMAVADYPAMPTFTYTSDPLDGAALRTALSDVVHAASKDATLPALNGVSVSPNGDGTVDFAATDRYRLATAHITWDTPEWFTSAIIPTDVVKQVIKTTTDVAVSLQEGANIIGFTAGERTITTRLIGGEFPKYRSLIPSEFDTNVTVDSGALADAVKRVDLVNSTRAAVKVDFDSSEVTVTIGDGDTAATDTIECAHEGSVDTVRLNPGFLADALNVFDGDICVGLNDPLKPVLVTSETTNTRVLLMPHRG